MYRRAQKEVGWKSVAVGEGASPQQGVSRVPSAGGGWVGPSPDSTAGSVITGDFGSPLVPVSYTSH